MFKIGDTVKATKSFGDEIIEGHKYKITGMSHHCIFFIDSEGHPNGWMTKYFEACEESSPKKSCKYCKGTGVVELLFSSVECLDCLRT